MEDYFFCKKIYLYNREGEKMRKIKFVILVIVLLLNNVVLGEIITGNVEKNSAIRRNKIVDAQTQKPVPFAIIKIPTKNYQTKTDKDGFFELNANINGMTIMSVEKSGYRPFSLTLNEDAFSKPLIIGIEKTQLTDLNIESNIVHIGDNNYSEKSANSAEFRLKSVGPFYSKQFKISSLDANENAYFVIGSVIGIDTLLARQMGQSKVMTSYASPAQIYFNGQKIAEIKYNSDGQQILLPKQLIRQNGENEITIKAGKNLFQTAYIDYDDIELANLHIEFKPAIANEN